MVFEPAVVRKRTTVCMFVQLFGGIVPNRFTSFHISEHLRNLCMIQNATQLAKPQVFRLYHTPSLLLKPTIQAANTTTTLHFTCGSFLGPSIDYVTHKNRGLSTPLPLRCTCSNIEYGVIRKPLIPLFFLPRAQRI